MTALVSATTALVDVKTIRAFYSGLQGYRLDEHAIQEFKVAVETVDSQAKQLGDKTLGRQVTFYRDFCMLCCDLAKCEKSWNDPETSKLISLEWCDLIIPAVERMNGFDVQQSNGDLAGLFTGDDFSDPLHITPLDGGRQHRTFCAATVVKKAVHSGRTSTNDLLTRWRNNLDALNKEVTTRCPAWEHLVDSTDQGVLTAACRDEILRVVDAKAMQDLITHHAH